MENWWWVKIPAYADGSFRCLFKLKIKRPFLYFFNRVIRIECNHRDNESKKCERDKCPIKISLEEVEEMSRCPD